MTGLLWFVVAILLAIWVVTLVLGAAAGWVWILLVVAIALVIYAFIAGPRASTR